MREDAPSRTAQWVAAARGLGRLLPEAVRIADDPYGMAFSSSTLARLLDRPPGPRAEAIARIPGLAPWIVYLQIRTRLIDDAVRAFVAAGGRQVVVLGAGYDCRALRLAELAESQVYEIDHPATQDHKLAVLAALRVSSPALTLAWDFETRPMDELADALADLGHEPAEPTLTIWEGVTVYLTEGAIDASLDAITSWSAPGSELAMTYFAKSPAHKPSLAHRAFRALVKQVGEPFKFGWSPVELPGYLAARGFDLHQDLATPDAARALMPPAFAAHVAGARSHVAFAHVAGRSA
jgi:methyltransferase (TIGR00027 family)